MGPMRPSEEMCAHAPGSFFHCSFGRVHYRLLGKPTGKPLVVCLHGISAEGGPPGMQPRRDARSAVSSESARSVVHTHGRVARASSPSATRP